jgi:hypothetical protein
MADPEDEPEVRLARSSSPSIGRARPRVASIFSSRGGARAARFSFRTRDRSIGRSIAAARRLT